MYKGSNLESKYCSIRIQFDITWQFKIAISLDGLETKLESEVFGLVHVTGELDSVSWP